MCLLNSGALTYVNPSSRNHSAIDLTICNSTFYMDFTWKVHDDICGSDHFPILIKSTEPSSKRIPCWKLDKANCEIFKEKCKDKLTHVETNHDIVEHFTEMLIEIAEDSTPNKHNGLWFNNKCQKAIRLQRAALKKFKKRANHLQSDSV